jgi:hypothetical protein
MKKQAHYRMKTAGVEEFLSRMLKTAAPLAPMKWLAGRNLSDMVRRTHAVAGGMGGGAIGAVGGAIYGGATAEPGNTLGGAMSGAAKGAIGGTVVGGLAGRSHGHYNAGKLFQAARAKNPEALAQFKKMKTFRQDALNL